MRVILAENFMLFVSRLTTFVRTTRGGFYCIGLLNSERRRRGIPLALQGAVVMGLGLGFAYLMYKLTTDDELVEEPTMVHLVEPTR